MIKICSKCGLEKDLTDFYRDRASKDGFRSDCKACHTPVVLRYQATERGRAVAKQVDIKRTGTKKRKASHNRATARYKQTERGRLVENACSHRRRELKAGLDANFSREDILEVYYRFDHRCFRCGSRECLSIDHHKPLSHGFGLSHDNAVLLCRFCNSSKGTKRPEEFYTSKQLKVLNDLGIV